MGGVPVKKSVVAALAAFVIGAVVMDSIGIKSVESGKIEVPGGKIDVSFEDGPFEISFVKRMQWVKRTAETVANYYGQFPVAHATLRVRGFRGSGTDHGRTKPAEENSGTITIALGRMSDENDLETGWELTHEMVHLAFPSVSEHHHWIEEGIATYVEPWARVRTGGLTPEKVWGDLMRGLPQGLPQDGDQGLDRTPTWGRTYWGGALYCLLADIRIREKTNNAYGLIDALRAINRAGGNISADWDLEEALKIGDSATHTLVLQELYADMKDKPYPVDLNGLWARLGVVPSGKSVVFNNAAPLAAVRRGIEMKVPFPKTKSE